MHRTAGRRTSLPDGRGQTGISSHEASAQTSTEGNQIMKFVATSFFTTGKPHTYITCLINLP